MDRSSISSRPSRWPRLATRLVFATLLSGTSSTPAASDAVNGAWSVLGVATGDPVPRREYASIYDKENNRYLIFGGQGWTYPGPSQLFNEVWQLTLGDSPTWSQLVISGPSPGERHSPQWGYDEARERLLIFGGYGHHTPSGPDPQGQYLNDVWQLDLSGTTPTWTELIPTGTPPVGRLAGAAVYDPLGQRFVGFGGTSGLPCDTWELDLSGAPAWVPINTIETRPSAGYGMASIYDPVRNRMVIFGGSTSDGYFGTHNELWALNLTGDPQWERLYPAAPPPSGRRTLSAIYDPLRDRMVLYGGWDGGPNIEAFLGETWALSLAGFGEWAQLAPTGSTPVQRDAMAAIYDPGSDRMVVFGGWSGELMLGDTQFLEWGGSAVGASLTARAGATSSAAQLEWDVVSATGPHAAVYRRQIGTPWSSIAPVIADAGGNVQYVDPTVTPGARYAYRLVVSSQQGPVFGGEVWVDIPNQVTGLGPAAPISLALRHLGANPVRDRLVVSFALPTSEPARIEVLDLAGRRVVSREVGALGAGVHQLELGSAVNFGRGIYFIRLAQSGRTRSTRVVIGD
ncbi:MAG: T9SS type A sorting domain-containing protein [Candidatus Eisenbacteria bacterium]|uniref:T9SS type A sorting domain-containing protein n=1 Tax=Eiseniibacteriota bacterium TaxID=2212470 RepID=A0A849SH41_UNCEI|nr:T9SS type A sorting domain-containing protein [Candidatus Eisenbacteria bacterium]